MVFTAPGFRFSFLAFSFSFAAGRFRHRRRGAQSLGGCHPWLHRWGRNIPLRHRRKRRRHLPLQGRPWCPVFRRRADHWSAALRDWGPGKQTDEQCSSLRLFRPRRRGGLWPPPFSLFRSGDHRSPLRLVRRPVSTVWPTIVPPVVLPPAGEAPAKRVMRENNGPQSTVEISEVDSVLPHLSAALTSSPAGGGTVLRVCPLAVGAGVLDSPKPPLCKGRWHPACYARWMTEGLFPRLRCRGRSRAWNVAAELGTSQQSLERHAFLARRDVSRASGCPRRPAHARVITGQKGSANS